MLALAVALSGCGAAAPVCELPAAPAEPHAWLWRVQAASGDGPVVWLFGTVHDVGGDEVPPSVWAALDGAAVVATELGDLEPDADALRDVIRLPRGKGLDQLLPTDKWWELRDALRGKIKEADLARVRPWYAMSLLTRTVSPPPDPQLDAAVVRRAKERGIPVEHLETWEEQLPQVADSVGVADLVEAIDARKTMRCDLARNRAAYAAGDEAWMLRTFQTERTAPLLGPRNEAWMPKVEAYASAKGAFVAVGIGHLLGDGGLPAMLARAGYRVEPPLAHSPKSLSVRAAWSSTNALPSHVQRSCWSFDGQHAPSPSIDIMRWTATTFPSSATSLMPPSPRSPPGMVPITASLPSRIP